MAKSQAARNGVAKPKRDAIARILVSGFKSIDREQSIEVRPLTVLAGKNSSGKSSIMQPLLLLKQTLEASYDPGALLLNGPNLRFTSADQLLSRRSSRNPTREFQVGLLLESGEGVRAVFRSEKKRGLQVERTEYRTPRNEEPLRLGPQATSDIKNKIRSFYNLIKLVTNENWIDVVRSRCFFLPVLRQGEAGSFPIPSMFSAQGASLSHFHFEKFITDVIHIPGLRGNPLRTYSVSAVGPAFPGTFEPYVASVVMDWQSHDDDTTLSELSADLVSLGLTWKVVATPLNETQVELRVGRAERPVRGRATDLVSIADVGFGVSQTLPVLVGLHAARPGQLVYIEQPEIHLHPRAQSAMAGVLARAAGRGVRVVVETHSELILRGIQTLVARGELPTRDVKLHWFERDDQGSTTITSRDLDETGAFGEWPEDFAEVALDSEQQFLDASEDALRRRKS